MLPRVDRSKDFLEVDGVSIEVCLGGLVKPAKTGTSLEAATKSSKDLLLDTAVGLPVDGEFARVEVGEGCLGGVEEYEMLAHQGPFVRF